VAGPALISVRTQVVLDTLVGSLADAISQRLAEPLAAPVEDALASAGDARGRRLARAGYLARALELERFEAARAPVLWLTARLQDALAGGAEWSTAAAAVAAELAAREPDERPDPRDERAASWKVPGPGGHVRHYLALRAAGGDRPDPDAKRAWLTGFFLHCCEEAVPPEPEA
jgi:hypothetical protein